MATIKGPVYLKVRQEGGTRVLALARFIPQGWKVVKVTKVAGGDGWLTIKIERMD